jgi:hypothetical protein
MNSQMTDTRPNHLAPPSLDAYPFIDILFHRLDVFIKHAYNEEHFDPRYSDKAFANAYFTSPLEVIPYRIEPLLAMTDQTFERLCDILEPIDSDGQAYRTKAELAASIAGIEHPEDTDGHHAAMLQTAVLHHSTLSSNIHWGRLAALYNESTLDQQEAISGFFTRVRNRSLEDLMMVPPPTFALPASLHEDFEAKVEQDMRYLFCSTRQKWLREDLHHNRYRVEGFNAAKGQIFLLATAPTLAQAIAKLSIYTQSIKPQSFNMSEFCVLLDGKYVAGGEFKRELGKNPQPFVSALKRTVNIRWNLEDDVWDVEPDEYLPRITKADFTKLLFATEKALGLQWSKVRKLEDELGL